MNKIIVSYYHGKIQFGMAKINLNLIHSEKKDLI